MLGGTYTPNFRHEHRAGNNWLNVVLYTDGEDWKNDSFGQEKFGFPIRDFFHLVTIAETMV